MHSHAHHQFHGDEQLPFDSSQFVDIDDVGVLEQTAEARLADEVLDLGAARTLRRCGLDHLERDRLAETGRAEQLRLEDPGHAAFAEDGLQLVATEAVREIRSGELVELGDRQRGDGGTGAWMGLGRGELCGPCRI